MASIIYTEDTVTMLANRGGIELVKKISKQGEFKQTETGYRYILIESDKRNEICPIHQTLLNEDGSCNKCLESNNK